MALTEGEVNTAYRIAKQKGIPLADESFDVLQTLLRPGEVLIALHLFGASFAIEGAKKISSEEEHEAYRAIKNFKHVGFFAVKQADLAGVRDLY